MAAFTAKDVSELRQRTGAGMMDCKKALEENDGRHGAGRRVAAQEGHRPRPRTRAGRAASEGKIVARRRARTAPPARSSS